MTNGDDGHRREYIALFRSLADSVGEATECRRLRPADVFTRTTLFSPMLEEQTLAFLLIAFLRAMIGLRSAALMFRPREAIHSRALGHRLKRMALMVARRTHGVHILTILPFELDAAFSKVARSWLYDPQLWDVMPPRVEESVGPLALQIKSVAAGRRVVVALGAQSAEKGFDYFAELWCASPDVRGRCLFVAAGKVSAHSQPSAAVFEQHGGLLLDRFMDDAEFRQLYAAADMVWAAYAPSYDQASGIFGRAVQTGVPVTIRRGSYLEPLADLLGHPSLCIPWASPAEAIRALRDIPKGTAPAEVCAKVGGMRRHSLDALSAALGLPRFPEGAVT